MFVWRMPKFVYINVDDNCIKMCYFFLIHLKERVLGMNSTYVFFITHELYELL